MTFDSLGNEFYLLSLFDLSTKTFERYNSRVNIETLFVNQQFWSQDYSQICFEKIRPRVLEIYDDFGLPIKYVDIQWRNPFMRTAVETTISDVPSSGFLFLPHPHSFFGHDSLVRKYVFGMREKEITVKRKKRTGSDILSKSIYGSNVLS